ncbi:MAG TPA: protein kinase [Anaeromyxobacteraceae bacterium]|nr:protein kinase [Anaeromyxobacteraceae bacterium]
MGRFEIVRELGRGGFGVVYEAKDRDLGRQVAVKVVRPGRIAEEEGKVSREAEAIARLAHPNLITLFEVGRSEHGPFLVFELLRGKTLDLRIEEGPLPVQEAVHIATEVARGLAHAHAEGVIHRDLKPANVFVTSKGLVKILDFGMAHAFGRRRLSGGTPAYMAPEQWEDDPEDERTDVFALGVMLYRMLTGEYPFPEGQGKWSAEPATPRKLDVPGAPELADLVEKMLGRAPKGRPRDGAAVLAALRPIDDRLRARPAEGNPPEHAKRRKATFADLLAELKRRHVFRVMIGYGVFAFAVLQVTEPIMHGADLPNWVLKAVLVALVLGFPVAVILAWAYDLTAQGVKRTPSSPEPGAARLGGSRLLLPLAVAAIVLLIATVGAGAWYAWTRLGERRRVSPAGPVAGAPGRTVVAVADVVNETGDKELDSLSGLLVTALQESSGLRVITRGRIYEAMRQGGMGDTARIDEALAREVGGRLGANALLVTAIRRIGETYTAEIRAIEPSRDEYLFAVREQAQGKAQVLDMIDRLAAKVLLGLHRESDAVGQRRTVAELATSNLEAYRLYSDGLALSVRGMPGVEAKLREAIRIQPDFALAHYELLETLQGYLAPRAEVQAAAEQARAVAEGAPWRERLLIKAWVEEWEGRPGAATEAYRQILARDPDDRKALARLGLREKDPAKAERLCKQAISIDPAYAEARVCLVRALQRLGRSDEVVALGRAWAARPTEAPIWLPAYALLAAGAREEGLTAARRAAELGSSGGRMLEGALEVAGEYREMESHARRRLEATGKGYVNVGRAMTFLGRRRAAVKLLDDAAATHAGYGYAPAFGAFLIAVGDGGGPAARERARTLVDLDPALREHLVAALAVAGDGEGAISLAAPLPPDSAALRVAQAREALSAGDAGRARKLVEPLAGVDFVGDRPADVLLAEACLVSDDMACAIAATERYAAPQLPVGTPYNVRPWKLQRMVLLAARAHERLGEIDLARRKVDRVLQDWADADPDLPGLAEARALKARVAAAPR